jgi:NgoMIV restriction enzyme
MTKRDVPSNADGDSSASIAIASGIFRRIKAEAKTADRLAGQISGSEFEQITRSFLEETFTALGGLRPGRWSFVREKKTIFRCEQYQHLEALAVVAKKNAELAVLMGRDYVIAPDILITRQPEPDDVINSTRRLVDNETARRASLRLLNNQVPLLHASISCKWTLRSDRAQNARSEALNLVRNRKGRVPHIVVVTGEPLPSRLTSIALGTGDIDCVYHFALTELTEAVTEVNDEEALNVVKIMVDGKRLKDISDLPLDLAV